MFRGTLQVWRAHLPVALLMTAILAGTVTGCGGADTATVNRVKGDTLTIYSSLPITGPNADYYRDLVNAQKLVLKRAGGRVGDWKINFAVKNSSNPQTNRWDPEIITDNARRAVGDRTVIAYIGEGESGTSALSIPILNQGGVLMVSPTDTLSGLTTTRGADQGEPDKYYPSGKRNFARVIPTSDLESNALLDYIEREKHSRIVIVSDGEVYGRSCARGVEKPIKAAFESVSEELGEERAKNLPQVVSVELLSDKNKSGEVESIVAAVAEQRPDVVIYCGYIYHDEPAGAEVAVAQLMNGINRSLPKLKILTTSSFDYAVGGDERLFSELRSATKRSLRVASVSPSLTDYTTSQRELIDEFEREYGYRPTTNGVIYGERAMRVVLAAIEAAGEQGNNRRYVIREAMKLAQKDMSITPTGDIRLQRSQRSAPIYQITGSRLRRDIGSGNIRAIN